MLIKFLRILLFPLSILYGVVVTLRNWLFDVGFIKATSFDMPLIAVGNLSVGGTGKTPMIEYLIRLLQNDYRLAVLSRGYKRKSKGYVLANEQASVLTIGDEPYQYFKKFPKIQVAVCESRVYGITQLLQQSIQKPNLVLLDDAYQHRKIKAGLYVLLTSYDQLFCDDFMMPTGNLREMPWGKKRATLIVVTKCPPNLNKEVQEKIIKKLVPLQNQQVFFTSIGYADCVLGKSVLPLQKFKNQQVIVVTGIAKPKPFLTYLREQQIGVDAIQFGDHHHFSEADLILIQKRAGDLPILTTEKDFMRLAGKLSNLYYLPIQTKFLVNEDAFKQTILHFTQKFE